MYVSAYVDKLDSTAVFTLDKIILDDFIIPEEFSEWEKISQWISHGNSTIVLWHPDMSQEWADKYADFLQFYYTIIE